MVSVIVALVAMGVVAVNGAPAAAAPAVDWPHARFDAAGSGLNPVEHEISPANVGRLAPASRWADPGTGGRPIVVGDFVISACTQGLCAHDFQSADLVWQSSTPSGDDGPVASSGLVFGVDGPAGAPQVVALDVLTGVVRWRVALPEPSLHALSAPGDGRLYVGGFDGWLFALDARTGTRVWSLLTMPEARSFQQVRQHVVTAGGVLYVTTPQAELLALDPDTGSVRWRAWATESDVAIQNGVVVAPAMNRALGADVLTFDASGCGAPRCEALRAIQLRGTAEEIDRPADWIGVAGDIAYVAAWGSSVDAVDLRTGRKLWSGAVAASAPPTIANGVVYVNAGGQLTAFDASGCGAPKCQPLIVRGFGTNRNPSTEVVVARGRVLFGGYTFAVADTAPVPPAAATDVRAEVSGSMSSRLTWQPPAPGDHPILGYTAESTDGTFHGAVDSLQTTADGHLSGDLNGLRPGHEYRIVLRAWSLAGIGAPSAPSAPFSAHGPPNAPSPISATTYDGSVVVSWEEGPTGGLPIDRYEIAASNDSRQSVPGCVNSVTFSNLTNGTPYSFSVTAFNADGAAGASVGPVTPHAVDGTPPATGQCTAPPTVPEAPSSPTVTSTSQAALVRWTPPPSDPRVPILQYEVVTLPGGNRQRVPATATSVVIDGLTAGQPYSFTVAARNRIDLGPAAQTQVVIPTRAANYPEEILADAPAGFWRLDPTASAAPDATGGDSGRLIGDAAAAPGLLDVDPVNRAIHFDGAGDAVFVPDRSALRLGRTLTVEAWVDVAGLPPDGTFESIASKAESYSLQLNGPNLEFTLMSGGVRHRLQTPLVPLLRPGTTAHVVATYDGTTQRLYLDGVEVAEVGLDVVPDANTNPLYLGSWDGTTEYFDGVIDEVAVYDHVLSPGRIADHRAAGRLAGTAPPTQPYAVDAVATDGGATLHWHPPVSDGGAPITSYVVTASPGGQSRTANGTTTTFTGLTPGVAVTFVVGAINRVGGSQPSALSTAVTPSGPPPSPTSDPTTSTSTAPPSAPTTTSPPPQGEPSTPSDRADTPTPRSGYWMLGRDGSVYAFGDAASLGGAAVGAIGAEDLEPTPSGAGYWIVNSKGAVYTRGDAAYLGGATGLGPFETVTAISATPSGRGYWLFTNLGRVLAFGDAPYLGDMSGVRLNGPVLDSIATPSGRGYYMVASDGGVFTFGDAAFAGSMGDHRLNAPVQSLVPDPDRSGYWLVASDGGIFAFDADFLGSMGDTPLNAPVTGMVAAGPGGYLMVGEDGGIFTFGSAIFHGSLGASPPAQPVTSVAVLAS